MNIQNMLKNKDTKLLVFIIIISISILSLFEQKTIISLIIIVLVLIYNKPLLEIIDISDKINKNVKKVEKEDIYYNNEIYAILLELRKFKKYNKISYKKGKEYMYKFFKTIHILENDEIMNANQYFDNAELYLKTSINYFQSITISLPERNMLDAIKYGDFEPTKKVNKLGMLCKKLYNQCYYILLNLSIKFNKEWNENPNIYTKEIDMNSDRTESYDKNIEINWSLY